MKTHYQVTAGLGLRLGLIALLVLLIYAASVGAQDTQESGPDAVSVTSQDSPAVPYRFTIEGMPTKAMEDQVRSGSQLERLKSTPPASVLGLRRRLRADERRIQETLRSNGYYAGRISSIIAPPADDAVRGVTITVRPGPQYTFADVVVEVAGEVETPLPDFGPVTVPVSGTQALAADIMALEEALESTLKSAGYPFAAMQPRRAEVDHARQRILVTLYSDPGPYHLLGAPVFSGLETVEAPYLQRLRPWEDGSIFDQSLLSRYRQAIIDTGLFTSVKVEPSAADTGNGGDALNIDVDVREGAHHTIGAVGRYSRDEGFGVGASWQHRNFFGQGETLDVEADASELKQFAGVSLSKPAFRRPDQVLKTSVVLTHEDNDAFEEYSAVIGAGLERDIFSNWRGGLGVTLEAAELRDANGKNQSYLVGLPALLKLDKSDSLLNPMRGYRLLFEVTPYAGQFRGTALFTTVAATGSYYYPVSDGPRPIVLATRLKLGSVLGEGADAIPANKRFYAGGGGSVRGFGYRDIGPLDTDNTPFGGRSVIETALEARVPVTDVISVVPFVDGGLISQDIVPSFSEKMRIGAGLGVRYDTPVGPFRLDLAVPLNRRPGVDNSFQFYISFGQAF